ncbi:GDYXXLXY domain-containing protein [Metabacillus litoralis]|uniref:GDYXXLXY domain-containing protein n=1 Tax=Metabacillus litoralis TaxID=152268 RepID=UPI0013156D14|nr:GDYXXLXY domain-containing protein [Metabacillus litoralis]
MSLKRKPSKMFWISLLIPLLVLSSMLIKPVNTMVNGKQITLATIPVDPRDLFYGDYVILDLEIEEIDISLLEASMKKKLEQSAYDQNLTVYVSLKKEDNGIYQAISVNEDKPDGLFVKGKMSPYIMDNSWDEESVSKQTVSIEYGINRFYVEEGTGLELEDSASKGQVLVSVKIHDGYPILTDIKDVK